MNEKNTISPFFIIFLIYVSMVGVGVLNFQRELIQDAGYDGWISVLLMAISVHVILWMIYRILSTAHHEAEDITSINLRYFGKWLGNGVNLLIVLYFYSGAFVEFRSYIEIIQVWIFPEMGVLAISIALVVLIHYTVSGGFRAITGLSFWGMILSYLLVIPILVITFKFRHPMNLLPVMNHSLQDIVRSSKSMLYPFMGFEALIMYYPFIKTPAKSQKWAHWTVIFVTSLYLITSFITFMYYSEGQLRQIIWPTLSMIMIIEVPILQRLEYLAISLWMIKIVANIGISLWVACRGMKNTLRVKPSRGLLGLLAGFLILEHFVQDRSSIRRMHELYSTIGLYVIYGYIPLMFIITQVIKKKRINTV
ncbi:GerAB/ArcD/ProY family transporter [Paenibacillus sp. GCM10023252]|uniref:GerAB/ArcD/ProY family transporter n=1 Tax=Paenibacillus sp. GCM10023252 TaxID=3252649 RepID=UPI0036102B43